MIDDYKEYAAPLLRYALAAIFLWFGISQLINPDSFTFYLPEFLQGFSNLNLLIYGNAVFEIILGASLALGYFVRTTSFLLGLHLLGIIFSLGYGQTAVRDFTIMLASFAVTLQGKDKLCLSKP